MKNRATTLGLAGLVALVIVAALWWRHRSRESRPAVQPPAARRSLAEPPDKPALRPPRPASTPAQAPIIDEVVVEKSSLCEGEENLITVRAHTVDGEDDIHLHGVVDGVPGMVVPIIAHPRRDDEPPATVIVFGRGTSRATAEIPPYEVRDCVVDRIIEVQYRLRVNTNEEYEFTAEIHERAATTPFVPVTYQWDFGDGSQETTSEPHIIHGFGQRPQETLYANLLVRVEAVAKSGEKLVGRRSLLFRNAAFSNLVNAGVVTLVVELTPRFPTVEDGVVTQGVRLWHHRPEPLRVDRLRTRRNSVTRGIAPEISDVSITDTLGTATIPSAGIQFTLTLDTSQEPNTASIDYLLDGTSSEGYPVKSVFSIMRPSPGPTPEHHVPVDDPVMKAKILRARELLGKPLVTDEEIWELERKRAFDDLDVAGTDGGVALPPTYPGTPR